MFYHACFLRHTSADSSRLICDPGAPSIQVGKQQKGTKENLSCSKRFASTAVNAHCCSLNAVSAGASVMSTRATAAAARTTPHPMATTCPARVVIVVSPSQRSRAVQEACLAPPTALAPGSRPSPASATKAGRGPTARRRRVPAPRLGSPTPATRRLPTCLSTTSAATWERATGPPGRVPASAVSRGHRAIAFNAQVRSACTASVLDDFILPLLRTLPHDGWILPVSLPLLMPLLFTIPPLPPPTPLTSSASPLVPPPSPCVPSTSHQAILTSAVAMGSAKT